jgi:hypothetical protein
VRLRPTRVAGVGEPRRLRTEESRWVCEADGTHTLQPAGPAVSAGACRPQRRGSVPEGRKALVEGWLTRHEDGAALPSGDAGDFVGGIALWLWYGGCRGRVGTGQ